MKTIVLFALTVTALFAQGVQLQISTPTTNLTGVSADVRITGTVGAGVTGLEFSVPVPPMGVSFSITPGPVITNQTAAKNLSCAVVNGKDTCLVWGMTNQTLADGVLVTLNYSIGGSSTSFTLALGDTVGSTFAGSGVVVNPGTALTINLASPCDLTVDGKTDINDVKSAVNQALGLAACTSADVTGRAKCDLLDVQRIVNAAVSGVCKTGM